MPSLRLVVATCFLAVAASGFPNAAAVCADDEAEGGAKSAAGIRDLIAPHAAPGLEDDMALFGQFVGDWAIRSEWYAKNGSVERRGRGHLYAGWILYGTALQDVWMGVGEETPEGAPPSSFGTTIRFYDADADLWRVVWIAPKEKVIQTFTARLIDNEIVLEGTTPEGKLERWIWSNFDHDSFDWRSIESSDSGKTWILRQRIWGKREH